MGRRQRQRARPTATAAAAAPAGRMARVSVPDQVWAEFRALAEPDTIATALGRLVQREVDREHARRLKTGTLDDQELIDALDRAHELHADLAAIVGRLERRLDRQTQVADRPGWDTDL